MWFPTNKPATTGLLQGTPPQLNNNTTIVVTTKISHPRARPGRNGSKGYGGHSVGETPGPIPNPEAKTHSADGTAPGRVWESRSPPDNHYTVESPNHTVGALPHLTPKTRTPRTQNQDPPADPAPKTPPPAPPAPKTPPPAPPAPPGQHLRERHPGTCGT